MEQAKHWLQLCVKQAAELPGRSLVPLVRAASCKSACCFELHCSACCFRLARATSLKSACCFRLARAASLKSACCVLSRDPIEPLRIEGEALLAWKRRFEAKLCLVDQAALAGRPIFRTKLAEAFSGRTGKECLRLEE